MKGWHGVKMDYDGGADARSSLLERLDGRLEGELSSTGKESYIFCAILIGRKTLMASI